MLREDTEALVQFLFFLLGSNVETSFNPLNAELNPICHLVALVGAHHILHVSRKRVNVVKISVGKKILFVWVGGA
jgi:hypothetical protein